MKQKKIEPRKWFIVVNSDLEYFCGLAYGGQPIWCSDYTEAKPLDNERKFSTLQSICWGKELELFYI
jgi:hypothetical protein